MIELRDYQRDLLERACDALASSAARIMLQLPTGGGKTRIAGMLLSGWLNGGRKAIWLTHRKELAAQTEGMLQEAEVTATANIQWPPGAKAPAIPNGVVILMAQTVSRRTASAEVWDGYDSRDLMIIDEAHHAAAPGWARAINQWPGPVLGMTATPWRLSYREGFDHLFESLLSGPQVADLQSDGWLCNARVLSPREEERIQGGQVDDTGEYSEPGIEEANRGRDVWTAGALRFWQKHGEDRQTVVYAVSVTHAKNLYDVFNDAGVPTGKLLAETPGLERAELIYRFQKGDLKALINVAVATEGFDLPDAACVLMTRPTMSLALYLQMAGRGLRPKQDSGDCVVLDLAGNSLRHGLPEEGREWSLRARGEQPFGDAPLIRCERCEVLSSAASHQCGNCGEAFGETCGRCGAWRAWKRWGEKTMCGQNHELVCDLCHYDAHVLAKLPVTPELEELAKMVDDDEISPYRDPFLKDFLEKERRRVVSGAEERKDELRCFIGVRESELADDNELDKLFENHLATLPTAERPQTRPQERRLFNEWEGGLKQELAEWRKELATLESQSIDGQLIFNNARDQLMRLLEAEAREADLLPQSRTQQRTHEAPVEDYSSQPAPHSRPTLDEGGWHPLSDVTYSKGSRAPTEMRFPDGSSVSVKAWCHLMVETTRWLTNRSLLESSHCPISVSSKRYLVSTVPTHPTGKPMRTPRKVNSLYVEVHYQAKQCVENARTIIKRVDQDPAQFKVRLS